MAVTDAGQIQSFESLIKEYSVLNVASFQRNYSWESDNIEDLYIDLKDKNSIFIGCLIFNNTGLNNDGSKVADVVDGQQRITTLFLLLAGLRDAVKRLPSEHQIIPRTTAAFSINPSEKIEEILFNGAPNKPRFAANPLIARIFTKNMLADPVGRPKVAARASDGRASRSLRSAYFKINEMIETDLKKVRGASNQLIWINEMRNSIMNLRCLRISSDSPHDALDVFLSLNSKGKPLSRADIIRGILLQKRCDVLSDESEIQKIHSEMHDNWSELVLSFQSADLDDGNIEQFFRYYLLSTNRQKVQKKAAPSIVEERVNYFPAVDNDPKKERTSAQKVHVAADLWSEIISFSSSYISVLKPICTNYHTKYYLTMLRALSDNYRILLMLVIHLEDDIDLSTIEEIARLSFVLSLRHYLGGGNAQELEGIFQTIANDLWESKDFAETIAILITEINKIKLNTLERFSKEVLALAKPTLHFIEWNLCDNQGMSKDHLPVWSSNEVHLEHIAPETPTESWIQSLTSSSNNLQEYSDLVEQLGNKTLLDSRINTSIKQADFSTKKTHYTTIKKVVFSYTKSSFTSTRDLAKLKSWTKNEIELRNQWLSIVFDSLVTAKVDKSNFIWFDDWVKDK